MISPLVLDTLQRLANAAWHTPSALRRTHHTSTSRNVAYLHLQDHSLALRYLFGSSLASYNKILVRDEYRQALHALETDSVYEQGVYVTGQSGIGKTCFLIYTLLERLREHKPVVVQLRASDSFYAFFTHTCTLHSLFDPAPLVQETVWALSDLRASTTIPLDIFQDFSAKVVQTTSPNVKYWGGWSKYRGAEMYIMDIWSEEEIADLSSLLGLDIEHMTALSAKWGGVPRMLLRQHRNNESQQDWELCRAAIRAIENHAAFLPALHQLDVQDDGTAPAIFYVLPLKDRDGNVYRRRYIVRVPTATLQNALAIVLQQMQSEARINFFLFMSIHPGTRSCARNIYSNWFHSLMTSGKALEGNWKTGNTNYYLLEALRNIRGKQVPTTQDASKSMNPPYYWIAPSGESPGFDCVLVTTSRVFAIQITKSSQLLSPEDSLDRLQKLFSGHSYWTLVFVGISDELVNKARKYWASTLTTSHIEDCIIDPVELGIPYKAFIVDDEYTMDSEAGC